MKKLCLALLLVVLCSGGMALAQAGGSLTGTIEGIVKVGDNPVPGALVTIASPALQGKRSIATGTNGDYIFRQLPPGTYAVTFALTGMKTVQRSVPVTLGGTSRQDATLDVSAAADRDRLGREHRRRSRRRPRFTARPSAARRFRISRSPAPSTRSPRSRPG